MGGCLRGCLLALTIKILLCDRVNRQCPRIGVEYGRNAETQRGLLIAMAERQAAENRHTERTELFREHPLHRWGRAVVGAVGELADRDAGDGIEPAGSLQLHQ